MTDKRVLSQAIKNEALILGFDACGIAPAHELFEDSNYLKKWLHNGYNAEMQYMTNHFEKRVNPTLLVEGAKSVIICLLNYFPPENPFQNTEHKIAKYAYGADYHTVVKDKLHTLLQHINSESIKIKGRAFVDSAPVLEKAWAREAGLGWIGKNGLLINKQLGSFCFIGELIVDTELEYDQPLPHSYCGNCQKCIDTCPTKAIVAPGIIDSRKCLSYNTIEHKGAIPVAILENNNGWVFGCDICQDVCPWNNKCKHHNIIDLNIMPSVKNMQKESLQNMNEEAFQQQFCNSPLKRTGLNGLLRNFN